MGSLHGSVRHAFGTAEWQSNAHAFLQACGLSLFVMDLVAGEPLFVKDRCGYCHLALDALDPGPLECYDRTPAPKEGVALHVCRAGISTYLAPVMDEGSVVCHVVVGGFVSSTRERRRLYEHLMGRGIREEVARLAVRSMPVFTRREIEAFAQLAATIARSSLLAALVARDGERSAAARDRRADESEAVEGMRAAEAALAVLDDPVETAQQLLVGALKTFSGEAGTIALSRTGGYVELVASLGSDVRPRGTKLRLDGGAAARALETGKIVIVRGSRSAERPEPPCTVVAPLMLGDTPSGTLELRLAPGCFPDAPEARRIERFARLVARCIAHSERFSAVSVALSASERVNALSCALDRLTDGPSVVASVLDELGRSFTFDVAGVVLTGWGHDRAEIVVGADVTPSEVEMLVGEAAGRDLASDPLDDVKCVERGGKIVEGTSIRENWAFICTPLACGNHDDGHLFCASASGVHYNRSESRQLEGMAEHAAAAIERAELFARIRADFARTIGDLEEAAGTPIDPEVVASLFEALDRQAFSGQGVIAPTSTSEHRSEQPA